MSRPSRLRQISRAILPSRLYLRVLAWRIGYFERELCLLPVLCDRNKISIDVGASNGSYTAHLLNHSAACYAFEPRVDAMRYLRGRLAAVAGHRLTAEAVALSDHNGNSILRVLAHEPGRSSLQRENSLEALGAVVNIPVPTRCLDEYRHIGTIGFVKIDVEGHEAAVLRGAEAILQRDVPSLIVEMEERHCRNAIKEVTVQLEQHGYQGFFLSEDRLWSIHEFDPDYQQNDANVDSHIGGRPYINNFIFAAGETIRRLGRKVGFAGDIDRLK